MKNLIKKIAIIFIIINCLVINSAMAQTYEFRVVNNASCSIYVTATSSGSVIFNQDCAPGTTNTCIALTNQPTQIDFTEVGATCIVQLTLLPGSTSCGASCICPCITTSRIFDASFYSTGGVCLSPDLWEITIN